jgi:hypothetical protein
VIGLHAAGSTSTCSFNRIERVFERSKIKLAQCRGPGHPGLRHAATTSRARRDGESNTAKKESR